MSSPAVVIRRIVEQAQNRADGHVEYQLRRAIQEAVAVYGAEGARMLADDMVSNFQDRMRKAS